MENKIIAFLAKLCSGYIALTFVIAIILAFINIIKIVFFTKYTLIKIAIYITLSYIIGNSMYKNI